MISFVPVTLVDGVWPKLREGMVIACEKGRGQYDADWLFRVCRTGEAYLLIDMDEQGEVKAGLVCQVQYWRGEQKVVLLAVTGKFESGEFRKFIRENIGSKLVWEGRPGWARSIPGARVLRWVFEAEA